MNEENEFEKVDRVETEEELEHLETGANLSKEDNRE